MVVTDDWLLVFCREVHLEQLLLWKLVQQVLWLRSLCGLETRSENSVAVCLVIPASAVVKGNVVGGSCVAVSQGAVVLVVNLI